MRYTDTLHTVHAQDQSRSCKQKLHLPVDVEKEEQKLFFCFHFFLSLVVPSIGQIKPKQRATLAVCLFTAVALPFRKDLSEQTEEGELLAVTRGAECGRQP